jgi:hypothetical protein
MTAFCIASSLFFLLLKRPTPQPEELNSIGNSVRESTKASEIETKTTVKEDILETAKLMLSKRMLKIIPFIIWTAVSCAIYAGVFVPLMTDTMSTNLKTQNWSDQTKQKNCLLALVGLGLGEILGSLVLGQIQDKYSNRLTIITCLLLSSLAIGITILFVRIYYF